jgi:N-acyl-D-aspartate/D-glutamate deacylase
MKRHMFIFFTLIITFFSQCNTNHFDIVITNGAMYDGGGNAPIVADIGIKDGIIADIKENLPTTRAIVIDAEELIVAPGFIDIHTHCDGEILKEGMQHVKNYLTQGVTTVVTGNCGGGTYNVEQFFRRIDSIGTGVNLVHLVGHNTVRNKVMGMSDRKPTSVELDEMKNLIAAGMEGGAAGISTGLFYTPGAYSSTEEIIELVKVVKKYNGFYATHLRDESNYNVGLEEAVKEAITVGEQTGTRVQISHIKALGEPVWGMSARISETIREARNRGICIFADQYPYNASSTGLEGAIVPSWVREGGKMKQRLEDPALIPRIRKEIAENIKRRGGPESLVIISYPKDRRFDGKNLTEISRILNKSVLETAIYLIVDGRPSIVSFNMKDSDIVTFMKNDFVMTGSDGSIVIPGEGLPHPRSYGSFARKIRKYVLEDKVISMEQAIKAATSMPAEMTGLVDRGLLKEGKVADIVIFNPETINDNATFADPHQYSSGVEYLLVNGDIVIEKGIYNGRLSGKPVRIKH